MNLKSRVIFTIVALATVSSASFVYGLYTHKTRPGWYVYLRHMTAGPHVGPWIIDQTELANTRVPPPSGLDIYILAGQSNMSGFPPVKPPQWLERRQDVSVLGYGGIWRLGRPPLHFDPPLTRYSAGFGPGLVIGNLIAKEFRRPVGLVPCALSGSDITQWEPSSSEDTLFGACLSKINKAVSAGTIRAILFHQGEQDANPHNEFADFANWSGRFSEIVSAFRDHSKLPRLPVVYAQIGMMPPRDDPRHVNWSRVKQQQSSIRMDCVQMIKTDDLPYGITVHIAADSFPQLAQRYISALRNLADHKCLNEQPE